MLKRYIHSFGQQLQVLTHVHLGGRVVSQVLVGSDFLGLLEGSMVFKGGVGVDAHGAGVTLPGGSEDLGEFTGGLSIGVLQDLSLSKGGGLAVVRARIALRDSLARQSLLTLERETLLETSLRSDPLLGLEHQLSLMMGILVSVAVTLHPAERAVGPVEEDIVLLGGLSLLEGLLRLDLLLIAPPHVVHAVI